MSGLIPIEPDGLPDDRVLCTDCSRSRRQAVEGGGKILWCVPFRSSMIPTLKRRCVKFEPAAWVKDRRLGLERWPDIQAEIEEIRRLDAAHAAGRAV